MEHGINTDLKYTENNASSLLLYLNLQCIIISVKFCGWNRHLNREAVMYPLSVGRNSIRAHEHQMHRHAVSLCLS